VILGEEFAGRIRMLFRVAKQGFVMWKIVGIVMCACLALTACGGSGKKAVKVPPPAGAQPIAEPAEKVRPLSPMTRGIVAVAKREWEYFGKQLVVYQGDEESIPHVGYWEDDDSHAYRVGTYWSAVNMPGLDGYDCKQPWSAAFISYVMQGAGVPAYLFPPSRAHWVYLKYVIADSAGPARSLVPHGIREYKPMPGDLICATREHFGAPMIRGASDAIFLENNKLHCDIVVARQGSTLEAIGGNVRNSVSKSLLTLDSKGYLQPIKRRPWFLVIENRL